MNKIISWAIANRFLVICLSLVLALGGVWAIKELPIDALPDLSDTQVIVQTDFNEQAPQVVEDQVTYPIASEMLKVPGAKVVRGYSFFGVSFVYIIFKDGTDLYWARTRVAEVLAGLRGRLPSGAISTLGPDATGLGWIYQYVLEDSTNKMSLADLRSLQDWQLRLALGSVAGVAEVATVGGFEKEYNISVKPDRLVALGVTLDQVMESLGKSNSDQGAMTMELSEKEYMVRSRGYVRSMADLEGTVVAMGPGGTPVRVSDVALVAVGPSSVRGVTDWNGRGDVVSGIVVMRSGANARSVISDVKARIEAIQPTLPKGVAIRPVYDRSRLIDEAIGTLRMKLIEESIVVLLVCLIFLWHARSALVVMVTLPLGVLMAFIVLKISGHGADIMSLGGIAIALGAMVDAALVMVENLHKHLEERFANHQDVDASHLTAEERWKIVGKATAEVGPALFFSLLIITVSFLPVFALEGQEGRLFTPLALTKSLTMAAAALLSITLVPVTLGLFVRGRLTREHANPVNKFLQGGYEPLLFWVLRRPVETIALAAGLMILAVIPISRIGSEFMPPLHEGTLLFMPTTVPGTGIRQARRIIQDQDRVLKSFPEVDQVWAKAGRANTATDPAGFDMIETTVELRPKDKWRKGMTDEKLVAQMDKATKIPGVANSWTMPIKGRIDMLATGIRTPVGIKIFGPDLGELGRIATQVEEAVLMVPGTRSVFAEKVESGYYLDIEINRAKARRYGLNVGDIEQVVNVAVGGMPVTEILEGRARYKVRVRYARETRDTPERLGEILIPVRTNGEVKKSGMGMAESGGATGSGQARVPLSAVAEIRMVSGPMAIRTEGAEPTAWVYVDVTGEDLGGYVRAARTMVEEMVSLPLGYRIEWSGQYEFMNRAVARMKIIVPATLLIVFMLLYFNFKSIGNTLIVLLSLPFAAVGGVWAVWGAGYQWSVAVAVGFIALVGVAAETGVIMLLYLDVAWEEQKRLGNQTIAGLREAIWHGAVKRVRPKMMTVTAIMAGLLPIFWGDGAGASVMRRIALPMLGGMISSTILTLLVIPSIYWLWKRRLLVNGENEAVATRISRE